MGLVIRNFNLRGSMNSRPVPASYKDFFTPIYSTIDNDSVSGQLRSDQTTRTGSLIEPLLSAYFARPLYPCSGSNLNFFLPLIVVVFIMRTCGLVVVYVDSL